MHIPIRLLYLPAGASISLLLAFKNAFLGTPIQSARGNLDKKKHADIWDAQDLSGE